MKKLFKLLLTIVLTFTFYALNVNAADVCDVDGTIYTKLSTCVSKVSTTGKSTITLLSDVNENITIKPEYDILLDLNNHTLKNDGNKNTIVNNGKLEIINGTITSDVDQGMINNNSGAVLKVGAGARLTPTAERQSIYNNSGTLYILDGAYLESQSSVRATVHNLGSGTIYILGGTIKSANAYAIYNAKGTIDIGTKDDIYDKTNPIIQGKTYAVVAKDKFNIYDGTLKGATSVIGKTNDTSNTPSITDDADASKINNIEEDSIISTSSETIGSITYKTLTYDLDNSDKIKIFFDANGGTVDKEYIKITIGDAIGELPTPLKVDNSFDGWFTEITGGTKITESSKPTITQTIFAHWTYVDPSSVAYVEGIGLMSLKDAIATGGNIRLEKDVVLSESLIMSKESNLDLNGHTISLGTNHITINNKVVIDDSSTDKTGKITSTDLFTIEVTENGDLTHKGGILEGLGTYGAIRSSGKVTIDGGYVTSTPTDNAKFTIYSFGELIVKSGTVTSTNGRTIQVYEDSTFTMDGGLVSTTAIGEVALQLYGNCSAVINGGTIEALNEDGAAVFAHHNTSLTVNGGTIKGAGMAITGNGSENADHVTITINGGNIIATESVAMYLPQRNSITTINGGNITGPTAIEIRASKLIVNGGNITATYPDEETIYNVNGTTTRGFGIAVSQHNTKLPIEVIINNGNFKGYVPLAQVNPISNPDSALSLISIIINKGNFESSSDKSIYAESNIKMQTFITGGLYTSDPSIYVMDGYAAVKLDDNKYEVTKIHNLNFDSSSENILTTTKDKYAYKEVVEISFKDGSISGKEIIVIDKDGNKVTVLNNKFIMPDSDVTIKLVDKTTTNPETNDNIFSSIVTLLISSTMLIALRKKNKKA